jgi:hypothetical protein
MKITKFNFELFRRLLCLFSEFGNQLLKLRTSPAMRLRAAGSKAAMPVT